MEIKEQVYDCIAEALEIEKSLINDDLAVGDIEQWDSMGNMRIMSTLEEKLEIEIPLEDLFDLTSVKAILEEVEKIKA